MKLDPRRLTTSRGVGRLRLAVFDRLLEIFEVFVDALFHRPHHQRRQGRHDLGEETDRAAVELDLNVGGRSVGYEAERAVIDRATGFTVDRVTAARLKRGDFHLLSAFALEHHARLAKSRAHTNGAIGDHVEPGDSADAVRRSSEISERLEDAA